MNNLLANNFYKASYRGYELVGLVMSEEMFMDGNFVEIFKIYFIFEILKGNFLRFELFSFDKNLKISECLGGYSDVLNKNKPFFKNWLTQDNKGLLEASMLYKVQLAILTAGMCNGSRIAAQSNLDKIRAKLLEEKRCLHEGLPLL